MRLTSCSLPRLILAAAAGLAGPHAHAARPMTVDDARIVDPKACQVESWTRSNRDGSREFWSLPSCNLTGRVELTLGGARTHSVADGTATSDVVLQAKGLIRPLPDEGWGSGVVVGNVRHPNEPGRPGGPYAYGIVSVSSFGGRLLAHTNLGLTRDAVHGATRSTWGVGTEVGLIGNRLQLLGEVFGTGSDRPFTQLGLRWWIVPERLQLDTTWGERRARTGPGERFITVGLRILTPAFLP